MLIRILWFTLSSYGEDALLFMIEFVSCMVFCEHKNLFILEQLLKPSLLNENMIIDKDEENNCTQIGHFLFPVSTLMPS